MKAQTTTTKPAKNAKNTPAKASKATKTTSIAKVETKPASSVFALVAGTIAKVENKHLKQAVAYHVSKGNLAKHADGIQLTAQGSTLWQEERIKVDPAQFQECAVWMHKNGKAPANATRFDGSHASTLVNAATRFPNIVHWGGFTSTLMRQCFAAIWAK